MKYSKLTLILSFLLSGCAGVEFKSTEERFNDEMVVVERRLLELASIAGKRTQKKLESVGLLQVNTVRDYVLDDVRNLMKDPDSVLFKDVYSVGYESGLLFCGKYNAKNSYGAYVGYVDFIAGVDYFKNFDNVDQYKGWDAFHTPALHAYNAPLLRICNQ